MKKNMGSIDRAVRIAMAAAIGVLYFSGVISGLTATVLLVIAAVFLVTGFIRICPLYLPFGIRTTRKK